MRDDGDGERHPAPRQRRVPLRDRGSTPAGASAWTVVHTAAGCGVRRAGAGATTPTLPPRASRSAHAGDLGILGEQHELRVAAGAQEQLEQPAQRGGLESLERLVEDQRQLFAARADREELVDAPEQLLSEQPRVGRLGVAQGAAPGACPRRHPPARRRRRRPPGAGGPSRRRRRRPAWSTPPGRAGAR